MSKDTVLGGYLINADGVRHQLPATLNPSDSTTEDMMRNVSSAGKGVLVMRCKPPPEYGPYELEVHVDSGNFLLMLNENDEGGDHSVRTLTNENMPNDLVIILGEKYPARVVTRDAKATRTWTTPAGIDYGPGSVDGNRVKHVLEHAEPNPDKAMHTVFNVDRKEVLGLVDDAWLAKGNPLPNDPGAYVVPMGRVVGTAGEVSIKIIVRPGINKIITAYPIQ